MKKKNVVKEENKRRMLERRRSLDYVSLQGLSTQTGCNPRDLDVFVLKELVDNALDACEVANPTVEVTFETDKFVTLTVKDNGRGLTEADVKRVTDFERSYSTKFHHKYPTRGALGNALKCVFGIPYALASALTMQLPSTPIRVRSKGKEYNIKLNIDALKQDIFSEVSEKDVPYEAGTEISVTLPIFGKYWGYKQTYLDFIGRYALFNPEANIETIITHPELDQPITVTYPSIRKKSKKFAGTSSIHWYALTQFKQLIEAYIRSIQRGEQDLTLRQFIKQFRGLSSDEKVIQILETVQRESPNIQHLSDLTSQDKLISKVYECMKNLSYEPSPDVLGKIGKKQLKNRIKQIYGEPLRFQYKKVKGIHREGDSLTPYVLEVAMAIVENNIKRKIHTGINHSPCLDNPFEGYYGTWTDRKGKDHEASIMRELLEKYKIDSQQPVVIIVHLICPNIEYESYGKGKININPFFNALAQALTDVCRFYPRYTRRKWSIPGKRSLAREYLIEELWRRKKLLEQYGEIPEDERTTQQGTYYKVRNQMEGEIDIRRDSFISALKDECISMGGDLSYREKLGIFAAERAQLFFKGNTYPVNWERIRDLATMGCDVILIEKEGVCTVLEPYASRRGVALLNSRGFATEYAQQLLELSNILRSNLFLLTDYDASGLLIAQKLPRVPRLGVDPQMISKLGLKRQDLEETYKAPKRHLDPLPPNLKTEVEEKRIEIDAVLAAIGPEKLWNYLEEKMLEIAPQRDLTRSVDLSIKLPPEIYATIGKIIEFIRSVGAPKQEDIRRKFRNWKRGFIDIEKVERAFQLKVIKIIRKDGRIQELAKQLNKLANIISKNSEKLIENNHD
jgi:DNA topoisomerase VI subunit B